MITSITYYPDKGISVNHIVINWGTHRNTIRQLLGDRHEEKNDIIDLSKYHNGSNDFNIIKRRDIYDNYQGQDNFFFFNYDKDDFLRDIEIHHGVEIIVVETKLSFDKTLEENVSLLKDISMDNKPMSDGEYFFTALKLTLADSESMGGEGPMLAYFYCAKNVDHLLD